MEYILIKSMEWLSVNKENGKEHERAIQRDKKTFGMIHIYYFD